MEELTSWLQDRTWSWPELQEQGFVPLASLPESAAWTDCLGSYLAAMAYPGIAGMLEKADLPRYYGVLLTGPRDTGKYTTATAAAGTLMAGGFYDQLYWLDGASFDEWETQEQVEVCVQHLFRRYTERQITWDRQPAFGRKLLLLERPERSRWQETVLTQLEQLLVYSRQNDLAAPLVLLVTEEDPARYPALARELLHLPCQLPGGSARNAWLDRRVICVSANSILQAPEQGKLRINDMTIQELVHRTKGWSYRQMDQLLRLAKLQAVSKAIAQGIRDSENFLLSDYPLTAQELKVLQSRVVEPRPVQTQAAAPDMTALVSQIAQAIPQAQTQVQPQAPTSATASSYQDAIPGLESLISEDSYDTGKAALLKKTYAIQ